MMEEVCYSILYTLFSNYLTIKIYYKNTFNMLHMLFIKHTGKNMLLKDLKERLYLNLGT